VSGAIGYVGLIVPQRDTASFSDRTIALYCRPLHSAGPLLLVFADTLGAHNSCPDGVSSARSPPLVGAPLFIYLLRPKALMSAGSAHARHLAEANRLANEIRLERRTGQYAYSQIRASPAFHSGSDKFQARPGEIVAILGTNASGKFTLLHLISGALGPPVRTGSAQRIRHLNRLPHAPARSASPWSSRRALCSSPHAPGNSSCKAAIPIALAAVESQDDVLIAKNALAQVGGR